MEIGTLAAAVIGSALGGKVTLPNKEIDFDALFEFSQSHNILPLVAYGLKKAELLPAEQKGRFANALHIAMAVEATQEIYLQRLSEAFREKEIKFMPLKGSVMKHLYPYPFLRTMCDLDIQYDTARKDEVTEILLQNDFSLDEASGTDGVNLSFLKPPYLHIEMHGVLMDADVPLYNRYFGRNFERTVPKNGSEVMFRDEDFFVFMVAHFAKHYFLGGTGLRSLADLWLYSHKKPNLDIPYIYKELKEINLDGFTKTILGVAGVLFDGKPADEKQMNICRYLFDSKTYGTQEHFETRNADSSDRGDYLKKRLFPDAEFMAINYPAVKKCKILLPLFWLIRLITVLFTGRAKSNDVTAVLSASKETLDARNIDGKPIIVRNEKFYDRKGKTDDD